MEHRWGQRHRLCLPVQLWDDAFRSVLGSTMNVSSSGAFIRARQVMRPLSTVTVQVKLSSRFGGRALMLRAFIVRAVRGGLGIEWCEPLPEEFAILLGYGPRHIHPLKCESAVTSA